VEILDFGFWILDWELPLRFGFWASISVSRGSAQSKIENPKSKIPSRRDGGVAFGVALDGEALFGRDAHTHELLLADGREAEGKAGVAAQEGVEGLLGGDFGVEFGLVTFDFSKAAFEELHAVGGLRDELPLPDNGNARTACNAD